MLSDFVNIEVKTLRNIFLEGWETTNIRREVLQLLHCNPPRQVAIRVLDQAGGIPFHAADKVWSYMYSTASKASAGRYSG